MVKLNVGCGDVTPADWDNIDISWNARISQFKVPGLRRLLCLLRLMPKSAYDVSYSAPVRIVDVARNGLPHESGSADAVYSSLFLDHLSDEGAQGYLREAFRVLSSGGIVRTLVGDVYRLVRQYVTDTESMAEGPPAGRDDKAIANLEQYLFREYVSHKGTRWYHMHRSLWDANKLHRMLADCGFDQIRERPFHDSGIEGIEDVETRDGHLIMEAVKP